MRSTHVIEAGGAVGKGVEEGTVPVVGDGVGVAVSDVGGVGPELQALQLMGQASFTPS